MSDEVCTGFALGLLAVNALVIYMALTVGIVDAFPRLDTHLWRERTTSRDCGRRKK